MSGLGTCPRCKRLVPIRGHAAARVLRHFDRDGEQCRGRGKQPLPIADAVPHPVPRRLST